jgi:hypothetical protein
MIVWLWDAAGPARTGHGVSSDEAAARLAAEACLLAGEATAARVEAAIAVLGTETLSSGYRRTGNGWQAQRGRSGISWKPLTGNPE